jgi:hypothetical protein
MTANGSERLGEAGDRRLTVPAVGLVGIRELEDGTLSVRALEPLSPRQYELLALWLEHEWPERREAAGGY